MKTSLNISKFLFTICLLFWSIETFIFLVTDGWHYRPIRQAEVLCDSIAVYLAYASILFFCYAVYKLVEKQIENA